MVSLRVPGDAGYDASVLVLCEAGVHHSVRCTTVIAFPQRLAERLGEFLMPVLFIEAPPGIRPEAKRTMMRKLTEAIDEAYHWRHFDLSARVLGRECGERRLPSIGQSQDQRSAQAHKLGNVAAFP